MNSCYHCGYKDPVGGKLINTYDGEFFMCQFCATPGSSNMRFDQEPLLDQISYRLNILLSNLRVPA